MFYGFYKAPRGSVMSDNPDQIPRALFLQPTGALAAHRPYTANQSCGRKHDRNVPNVAFGTLSFYQGIKGHLW